MPPPIPNVDPSQVLNGVSATRSVPSLPPRKYQGGLHQSTNSNTIISGNSPNQRLVQSQSNPIPTVQTQQPKQQKRPNDPDSWLYEDSEEVAESAELIDLMEQTFRTKSRQASLLLMDDIIDHCVNEADVIPRMSTTFASLMYQLKSNHRHRLRHQDKGQENGSLCLTKLQATSTCRLLAQLTPSSKQLLRATRPGGGGVHRERTPDQIAAMEQKEEALKIEKLKGKSSALLILNHAERFISTRNPYDVYELQTEGNIGKGYALLGLPSLTLSKGVLVKLFSLKHVMAQE